MNRFVRLLCLLGAAFAFLVQMVTPTVARELRVGVGFALPPYVIESEGRGLEIDVIRESLARAGHEVTFVYLPNLRLPIEYAQGNVDCVVANADYDLVKDSGRKGFSSNNTIAYQNAAISVESCSCNIRSIADLSRYRVLGFNNATKYLGARYVDAVSRNQQYSELADQALQVRMLLTGRVDVVVSDVRIFKWWFKQLKKHALPVNIDVEQRLVYHEVFPPAYRNVTFVKKADRDDFNRGLEELRATGRLDAIIEEYVGVEPK